MKANRQHAGFSLRSRLLGAGWDCTRRISPVSICGLPLASSPRQKMKDVRSMKCRLSWSKSIVSNLFERDRRVARKCIRASRLQHAVVLTVLPSGNGWAYKEVQPPERVVLPVAQTPEQSLKSITVPADMEV